MTVAARAAEAAAQAAGAAASLVTRTRAENRERPGPEGASNPTPNPPTCPVCERLGHGADKCPGARPWPPPAAPDGSRFWFARGHPSLPDGVHVLLSLENRGVDPSSEGPTGILKGFATVEPVCRRGSSSGVGSTVIHWE